MIAPTWHLENRKISSLQAYHKNPRVLTEHQADHLRISLKKFGLIDCPAINLDNTVIGGHQRLEILKSLGHKEVQVMVPDRLLTEKEVEECNVRLNKNVGEWDYDILANEFEDNDLFEWGFLREELQCFPELDEKAIENLPEFEEDHKCPTCNQPLKKRKL